jgi:hypothetical protein
VLHRRYVFEIRIDQVRVGDHRVQTPEHHRPPRAKGGKLRVVVAAELIGDVNTAHVLIVVVKSGGDRNLLRKVFSEGLSCLLRVRAILARAFPHSHNFRPKIVDGGHDRDCSIVEPQSAKVYP